MENRFYINEKVAVLAKEIGLNLSVDHFYYKERKNSKLILTTGTEYESERDCVWDWNLNGGESGLQTRMIPYPNNKNGYYFSAPTCEELKVWLIEKHRLEVLVYCNASGWVWELNKAFNKDWCSGGTHISWSDDKDPNERGAWNDYHEAFNEGLFAALEYIKKIKSIEEIRKINETLLD